MPQRIEFQGQVHEFPDGFSNDQIKTALASLTKPQEPAPSWLGQAAGAWWEKVNPITQIQGIFSALQHPVEAGAGMLKAQDALRVEAIEEFKAGNYSSALTAATNYLIPLLGPESQKLGEIAQEKGIASPEYVGGLAGLITNLAAPAAIGKVPRVRVSPALRSAPAPATAAFEYLEGKGIPVPAGVRTQNRWVRGIQEMADTSPAGATLVHPRTKAAIAEGTQKTASELVEASGGSPTSPLRAGQGIRGALERKVSKLDAQADAAYERFRQIEAEHPKAVEARGAAETEEILLPVDVRPVKADLVPLYEDMQKWWEPARRNASRGFQAIKSIIEGPDFVQASVAEKGLSGLKDLAREARTPSTRTVSQGTAAFAASKLQKTIDDTVARDAGGRALAELRRGRRFTAGKYTVDDILRDIREEPVQAFNQAVYANDSGVGLLRKVRKEAPGELRKVGRAWLEDAFGTAMAEEDVGLVSRGQGLWGKWNKLGPETRKLLFAPEHAQNLDKFFLGLKKLSESPNPSQTKVLSLITTQATGSLYMIATNPLSGVPYVLGMGALSKMLNSPRGVAALTKGLTVPLGNKAAAAAAAGQILKLAGEDAKPYALPKAAESRQEQPQIASLGR